jgi:hypothetical protein
VRVAGMHDVVASSGCGGYTSVTGWLSDPVLSPKGQAFHGSARREVMFFSNCVTARCTVRQKLCISYFRDAD